MHHKKYALTRALLCFAVDSEQQNNANQNHVNILWYTLPLSANLWGMIYPHLHIFGYIVSISAYSSGILYVYPPILWGIFYFYPPTVIAVQ